MPTALIIGSKGQDGTYLSRLLREKGYAVAGIDRRSPDGNTSSIDFHVDIGRPEELHPVLTDLQPDEIYFLAAFHHSSQDTSVGDRELVHHSIGVNTLSFNNLLSGVVSGCPAARVFYAASSRIFGAPTCPLQNEDTPFRPTCPYGISKAAGVQLCSYYRETRGIYAAAGILYNHESPLRPAQFVSRKIVRSAVGIARGSTEKLVVGDLEMKVDWGYAPDYTRAMWQMLQLDRPSDFVVGTGILHSVRDLVQVAFSTLGLDWEEHVEENPAFLNRVRSKSVLCANNSKLRAATGWRPEVDFRRMVQLMIDAEKERNDV